LASQQTSLLGFAELTILSTNVELSGITELQTVSCFVNVSNYDTHFERRTRTTKMEHNITWNSDFEFRCGLHWSLDITLVVHNEHGEIDLSLNTESISVDDVGNVSHLLFLFDVCVGEVTFSLEFYPNHASFRCLTIDYTLHNTVAIAVVNELLTLISHQYNEDNDDAYEHTDNNLTLVLHLLTDYLAAPETLSDHLYTLYNKSNHSGSNFSLSSSPANSTPHLTINTVFSTNSTDGTALSTAHTTPSSSSAMHNNYDDTRLSAPKMATIARSFLRRLVAGIPQV
jgi:hypothetical protein